MSNTITLSTDMNTLYLIDDERAIPFDLNNGKGVLIGTMLGQVTVVTANGKLEQEAVIKKLDSTKNNLPVKGNQWTVMYNEEVQAMYVIGALDIESGIQEPNSTPCKKLLYNLGKQVVSIRREGNNLAVAGFPKTKLS